jgi:pimeloyl-ACP methyl ester carboxylesterase
MCPPLADEHVASYRILYGFSEYLAEAGIASFRFDPPGQGDSEGHLSDATPEEIAGAAQAAAQFLRERADVEKIGFLGVRLGCTPALVAANSASASSCVAWAPILSAEHYFRDLLRRQVLSDVMYGGAQRSVDNLLTDLTRDESVDIGGYLLSRDVYDGFRARSFAAELANSNVPVQVIQSRRSGTGCPRDLAELVANAATEALERDDEPFWSFPRKGSLPPVPAAWYAASVDWIRRLAADEAAQEGIA